MREGYTREELEAEGLLDFRVFLMHVWDYLGLPEPTKVQLDLAYNLQYGDDRFILQAFRGVGKSWITVAFVCWNLLLDPQLKIEVVSANSDLAGDFTRFCKQLIHGMPVLQHLAPRGEQKDSGESFSVGPAYDSKDPSVKSVGITGQITGSRADLLIADDVEVPKNSYTHGLRERLSQLVKEFGSVLKPGGRIIYLGTPQTEATLYTKLATTRGYTLRIWPAEVPDNATAYNGRLAPFVQRMIDAGAKPGTPVEPIRFPVEELLKRRLELGEAEYMLQFMLNTNPSDVDRHPLKLADLLVTDADTDLAPVKLVWSNDKEHQIQGINPGGFDGDWYYSPTWRSTEVAEYGGTVMAVDPSGQGNDETAYAIVKYIHGQLYWVASGGFKDGFGEDTLRALAAKAARHKVGIYVDETNYGGGMFTSLITPHLRRVGINNINPEEWDGWSRGQKELRILDTLEPLARTHKIIVDRQLILDDEKQQREQERFSVVYQYTRMARIKGALGNEDRLEAFAMACKFWTNRMDRDTDQQLKRHREALDDMEIRAFLKGIGRTGPKAHYRRYQGKKR